MCDSLYHCCSRVLLACRSIATSLANAPRMTAAVTGSHVLLSTATSMRLSVTYLHNFLFGWLGPRVQAEVWLTLMLAYHKSCEPAVKAQSYPAMDVLLYMACVLQQQ